MLIASAFIRTIKDVYRLFYYLVASPLKIEAELGQVKTGISFIIASLLMLAVIIFPYLHDNLAIQDPNMVYLNFLQSPQEAKNASYLCKFRVHNLDPSILNYSISADQQEINIFTGKIDFNTKDCKEFPPGYLYNDFDIQGTLIHVFYSGALNTTINSTKDSNQGATIVSDSPMRIFIRNKNAVLIPHKGHNSSLVRLAKINQQLDEHYSFENSYLNYSRQFMFKNADGVPVEKIVIMPKVYFYEFPSLHQHDVTHLAAFKNNHHFTVSLEMPDLKGDQSFKTFVEIAGEVDNSDSFIPDGKIVHFSFIDYIDTDEINNYRKTVNIFKILLSALGALFSLFFVVNLYTMRSATSKHKLISTPQLRERGLRETVMQTMKEKED